MVDSYAPLQQRQHMLHLISTKQMCFIGLELVNTADSANSPVHRIIATGICATVHPTDVYKTNRHVVRRQRESSPPYLGEFLVFI